MYANILVAFFIVLAMPTVSASYDPPENNTVADSDFLQKLRRTKDPESRVDLILSIEKKVSESTRKSLEIIALDSKEAGEVRMQAICSLGSMANQKSLPILLDILESELHQHRGLWACVIPALAELKDRKAVPLLIRTANQREEHLAGMDHMAIEALAEIGDEKEIAFLTSKAYITPVRLAVIEGLARIASVKSIDTLIEALQGAEDPEIVQAAQRGIVKIGKAAIPALNKTLEEFPKDWDKAYTARILELINKIQNTK
ncbi:HEAT repeat domain-containing protein [uncultured Cocleimonas sp.]|uniref:HEAT repeat domain-containing protein n=1 Tax=uncultured Cocleimonas sp. TaxID=1051587 RepID=UPI00260B9436|nr:HEAT repeat domain-containing protein [uncultured Cocleimonas sp.]